MLIAEAILCLALNVYHEAKNQSLIGQIAVAQVVMNRVNKNMIKKANKRGKTRKLSNSKIEEMKNRYSLDRETYLKLNSKIDLDDERLIEQTKLRRHLYNKSRQGGRK